MKITSKQHATRLKPTIGTEGVQRLTGLLEQGHEVWFIPDVNAANSEPSLTPEERAFARQKLQSHPWTWVHRPSTAPQL